MDGLVHLQYFHAAATVTGSISLRLARAWEDPFCLGGGTRTHPGRVQHPVHPYLPPGGRTSASKTRPATEHELRRLDRYEVLILDDIGYVQQSRDEMEVLFTLLAERYERRSVIITSNLVFSQWEQIFKDPMTTAAAIDRVVHHSIIVEFGKEIPSHRAQQAAQRSQQQPPG